MLNYSRSSLGRPVIAIIIQQPFISSDVSIACIRQLINVAEISIFMTAVLISNAMPCHAKFRWVIQLKILNRHVRNIYTRIKCLGKIETSNNGFSGNYGKFQNVARKYQYLF